MGLKLQADLFGGTSKGIGYRGATGLRSRAPRRLEALRCSYCANPIERPRSRAMICRCCDLARKRKYREAAAAGLGRQLYKAGSAHWKRKVRPEEFVERVWRSLEESNARQAWEFWISELASEAWLAQAYSAFPWRRPGLTPTEAWRLRYRHDPEFHVSERLRIWRRKLASGRVAETVRAALRGKGSRRKLFGLLGYTLEDLRRHIERQFSAGMSWPVFMTGRIHIDHIRPLSCFYPLDSDQFKDAWSLTNLRPMWATANLIKGKARLELV